MTVHRFIPATEKHEAKTACGIKLIIGLEGYSGTYGKSKMDGGLIEITGKGQPFDCKRCRQVLELHHKPTVLVQGAQHGRR